jgi:23S rRNA pseudouridine2605 synthase
VCIVLREGKNREVRRLFEHFGYEVRKLHRSRYGTITVRSLARGEYRHLTRQEVLSLRKLVGLS